MSSKTVSLNTLLITVLFTGLAMWIIGRGVENPHTQDVTIDFPGSGKITVRSESNSIDIDKFMSQLLSTNYSKRATLGWLQDSLRLYSLESAELAEAIRTTLCEPIPNEPLQDHLDKAGECESKPLALALRQMSKNRVAPFHDVGKLVRAGVQAEIAHRPQKGYVNVCKNGQYVAERLRLIEPTTQQTIEVQASGTYDCFANIFPELQLHPDDARSLFGRPPDKFESVVVVAI